MSAPKKLRGGSDSELTKLKEKWRVLAEDLRSYWAEQFASNRLQSELRAELSKKLSINLRFDSQLTKFRRWVEGEELRAYEAENVEQDKAELEAQGLKGDELTAVLLDRMKRRSAATGDFKLGLKAIATSAKINALSLDRDKFKESLRTKIQAGLDAILAEASNNPAIRAAVEQIQKATAKE
jgi:hypothetical protein